MKVLSIIIPIYNEEKTIRHILKTVIEQPVPGWNKEIIVVDDGSTDKSREILQYFEKDIILIHKIHNRGRGAAIRQGIEVATGDAIIFQDGDLEYNPTDWEALLNALKKNMTIYGTRMHSKNKKGYMSYYAGNKIMTAITNILFNSHLTDVYTGYKLFDAKFIKSIPLKSTGFELEAEITANILKKNLPIYEIPISYSPRSFRDGKKIYYSDGFIGLWTLLKIRFQV